VSAEEMSSRILSRREASNAPSKRRTGSSLLIKAEPLGRTEQGHR